MRGRLTNQNLPRLWRAASVARFAAGFALLFGSAGCASNSYMGISLVPGAADPIVQSLAARAQSGDKQAQYRLGLLYEEGATVPLDILQAKKLYRSAASNSGGMLWVWSPAVGNTPGRTIAVNGGPPIVGLHEAREKLAGFATTCATSPNVGIQQTSLRKNRIRC